MADTTARVCSITTWAHRLVDLDHLLRQAGAQVGRGAFHDTEEAGEVVRDLLPQPKRGLSTVEK